MQENLQQQPHAFRFVPFIDSHRLPSPQPRLTHGLNGIVRNTETSEAVEASIGKWVAKLEKISGDLISCRVAVEAPLQNGVEGSGQAVFG